MRSKRKTPAGMITLATLFLAIVVMISQTVGCKSFGWQQTQTPTEEPKNVFATPPANVFVSPYYGQLKPRRIVIVTPGNRTSSFREQDKFATALSIGLRQNGVFEAVIGSEVNCDVNAIQAGKFDEHQLVELAQHYNADAVLYGEVSSFSAYDPMSASISLSIVDARESVVLFSSDGTWDLRSEQTMEHFRRFLGAAKSPSLDDLPSEQRPESPSEFISFVAFATAKFIARY